MPAPRFSPNVIVVSRPVAPAGSLILAPAEAVARHQTMPGMAEQVRTVLGQLGEDAEVVGAAVLPLRDLFSVPVPEDARQAAHRHGRSFKEVKTVCPAPSCR